ncbi:EamA family transporter [Novosphingobium sp. PC22D]|uniref:DMT family transporter n=1 Tax=Novosphingobium sp. PC22D TaxID=1962403 RepID=UPI000BF0E7AD|nr:DMT family transporter [Novosphingobium sp. PC22D]PEQ14177.1 EamA family transporter [Novosphingobium sp. PC22D]
MQDRGVTVPIISVILGIAAFSAMDVAMKSAAIAAGVFSAVVLRNLSGAALALPLWLAWRRRALRGKVLRLHLIRAAVVAAMAPLFFFGIVRIPLAEAIAISFIAPLIALYLASLLLGERIRPGAILASLLGLVGVAIIAAGRIGRGAWNEDAALGTASILCSAVFYALNLVIQRRQAQVAGPLEIAFFQNLLVGLIILPAAPWLFAWPDPAALRTILLGAVLATVALLLLSWGYARAEAQVLLPIEYTGFLWAALFGWLAFDEKVAPGTLAGAVLIVAGCMIAGRRHTEQTSA